MLQQRQPELVSYKKKASITFIFLLVRIKVMIADVLSEISLYQCDLSSLLKCATVF